MLIKSRLLHFSEDPRAFTVITVIGLLLVLPSLAAGFFADDFAHYVLVNEPDLIKQRDSLSLFHLFSFIDTNVERSQQLVALSMIPWWVNPEFSVDFWRPLAEITHYIDYRYFSSFASLMHLQSLVWYALLLVLLVRFYRNFCSSQWVALLALILFVADSTHGFTVAWLANRNAVLAAVFFLLAIDFHHQYRSSENKKRIQQVGMLLLSVVAIACSFLSAEMGVTTGVFLLSYALLVDYQGWKKGLLHLLPALLIFVLWWLTYKTYGYGAVGNSAYYVDPVESPLIFIDNFLQRFPRIIAVQFNLLPLHLISSFNRIIPLLGWLILLALLLPLMNRLLVFIQPFAEKRQSVCYRFFLLSMLLAVIPISSGEVQDRNMLFVGMAACPLLAELIAYLVDMSQRFWSRILVVLLLVFHVVISGLLMFPVSYAPKLLAANSISAAKSMPELLESERYISFGAPLFDISFIAAIRRAEQLSLPERLWNVTTRTEGLQVSRLTNNSFQVKNSAGLLGDEDFLLRDMQRHPIKKGQQFDLNGLLLTVEEINSQGVPTKALLEIVRLEDSNNIKLLYWHQGIFSPMVLAIGEKRNLSGDQDG